MLGAAIVVAPVAIIGDLQFRHGRGAALAAAENAPSTARSSTRCAPAAGPTAPRGRKIAALADRLGRRSRPSASAAIGSSRPGSSPRPKRRMLEEAAGDAEIRPTEVKAAFAELAGAQARARPKHLRRASTAASVQPQRLLGSLGAQAAPRRRRTCFSTRAQVAYAHGLARRPLQAVGRAQANRAVTPMLSLMYCASSSALRPSAPGSSSTSTVTSSSRPAV